MEVLVPFANFMGFKVDYLFWFKNTDLLLWLIVIENSKLKWWYSLFLVLGFIWWPFMVWPFSRIQARRNLWEWNVGQEVIGLILCSSSVSVSMDNISIVWPGQDMFQVTDL